MGHFKKANSLSFSKSPCLVFSLSFPWYPLTVISKKEKRKKISHIINGITILWLAFPARVPPLVPSLGALILGLPHTRTLSYTNNGGICGICCWGEKGVEGVLCVAYFRGGPLLVLKLIRMAWTAWTDILLAFRAMLTMWACTLKLDEGKSKICRF